MPSTLTLVVGGLTVVYIALRVLAFFTQNAKEPPVILNSIPFLSPIFGLLRHRYKLYLHLLCEHNVGIYTLRLPFARVYIPNDTTLIPAIERQSKVITFTPFKAEASANSLGMSATTRETMTQDPNRENAHFTTFHAAIQPTLAPGPALDLMNQRAIKTLTASFDTLNGGDAKIVDMFKWVRHEIIMATTDAEYGPGNPFRNAEFEEAWYKFEPAVPILSTPLTPEIFAPSALKARELLVRHFDRYFQEGHDKLASLAMRTRVKHGFGSGMTPEDTFRGEVGSCLGLFNNTLAPAFWMLYHVFSNPQILEDCRRELAGAVREEDGVRVLDLGYVKSSCSVMLSTLEETFRFYGVGTIFMRRVLDDHMLDNRYLLKKGGIVIIPSAAHHFHPDIWGPTAREFNYRRFINPETGGSKRYNAWAFRIFGGGATLCPGRHFAVTEILTFASLAILRLNMQPAGGKWTAATTDKSFGIAARIFLIPENDVQIRISSRSNEKWRVQLPEPGKSMASITEYAHTQEKLSAKH